MAMVRSYTSDPAAGRRFMVGIAPSRQTGGILGEGLTPQEAQAARSQRLAEEMGLAPELQAVAGQFAPEQVKQLGLRSILEKQEQAARQQQQERQFQQQLDLKRQQQAQEQQEKAQQIEYLISAHKGQMELGSPVEWEKLSRANPQAAWQMLHQSKTGAMNANQRAMQDAAKRSEQKRLATALTADFDPEVRPQLEALIEQGHGEKTVRAEGMRLSKGREEAAKRAASLKEAEAYVAHDPDLLMRFRAIVEGGGDPMKAVGQATKERAQERAEAKRMESEERKQAQDAAKEAKEDAKIVWDKAKEDRAAWLKEDPNRENSAEHRMWNEYVDRMYQDFLKAKDYAMRGATSATAPKQQPIPDPIKPGAGDSSAVAPPAAAPPPVVEDVGTDPAAAQVKPGENVLRSLGIQRDASAKFQMGVPPQTKETLKRVRAEIVKRNPSLLPRYLVEVAQLAAKLPDNQSADDAWIQAARQLAAKYEMQMVETVERVQ